jgi:adenosylmethionine---8-amino-7-oxononanoate aminotransferase
MAVQYWRNRGEPQHSGLITLHHAYHGDTVGAMSASEDSVFTRAFTPLLFPVERAYAPYCYRCPLGLKRETCGIDCLGDLERCLEEHGERTAAVLIEPMLQGAGGMIVWPAEFLGGVRRLCDRYGVLLIADEVLTGFGRTGRMFACEHAQVTPDILCLSKALTAGYLPLGVTAATDAIYEAFLSTDRGQTFFHGHSYTANPLACAVAIASLDLFRENHVLARVARLEQQMRAGLEPLRSLPRVGDVRVIGGVGVVELAGDSGYLADIGTRLGAAFLERNLLLRPLGNIVYFMPPYAITDAETQWALAQIGDVLDS